MSEFLSHEPEELFYRGAIPQFGVLFEVANYSDQKLAEKSKMERGYHVELSKVSRAIMNSPVVRAVIIMSVLEYIEDEIYKSKKDLEENRGKTEDEIRLGIKLETFKKDFGLDTISLIFKRVPEDFAREANQKRRDALRYKSVQDQVLEQERWHDSSKTKLN